MSQLPANPPSRSRYVVALGSNSIDEYYASPAWPVEGTKVRVKHLSNEVGGMIANAAAVMACYGMETFLLDVLGNDADTETILNRLHEVNIRTDFVQIDESSKNAKTLIVLSERERTIFVVENSKAKPVIDERVVELISQAGFLYTMIDELTLLGGPQDELLKTIKEGGVRIVLDVESGSITDVARDRWYCQQASILLFNESGFDKLRGTESRDVAVGWYLESGVEIVVITRGPKGCEVFTDRGRFAVHGFPVEVVDTTGAGDTFNASFVYGIDQGWSLEETAQFANAAAARSTLAFGPRSGCASLEDVMRFRSERATSDELTSGIEVG